MKIVGRKRKPVEKISRPEERELRDRRLERIARPQAGENCNTGGFLHFNNIILLCFQYNR
jgi:hypothetical protein